MKRILITTAALLAMTQAMAATDTLSVSTFKVAGPYTSQAAVRIDSVDASGNKYNNDDLLKRGINAQAYRQGRELFSQPLADKRPGICLSADGQDAVFLAGFTLENAHFAKVKVNAKGDQQHVIYVDDKEGGQQDLMPGRHDIVIKVLCQAGKTDSLEVTVESEQGQYITLNPSGKRLYTLADYMNGNKASTTQLSATGRYLLVNSYTTYPGGRRDWKKEIVDLKTGFSQVVSDFYEWSGVSDCYISSLEGTQGELIYSYVDPATGRRDVFFTDYGKNRGNFILGDKVMLVNKKDDGPRDDKDVHQILEPDDRQPGWRDRNNVQWLDVATDQLTQLTVGHQNTYADISNDGRLILLQTIEEDMTQRPFSFQSLYLYHRDTQQLDTLVRKDGFLSTARFMPDGKSIILQASPEAFGGLGKNDPSGKIPSMIQQELFQMDLATMKMKCLTFDFNPNISSFQISKADGCIYALCENRDRQDIFRINPTTGKITRLKLTEQYISRFSLAENKPMLSYTGQSDSNADRVYAVDLKSGKESLVRDWNKQRMGDILLGKCEDWNFKSSRGDTIYGRYYLPPHFDAAKRYPMLVYYYGGCSPTGRYLESYYNFHGWAAMGYVVYVVQPSGCTGFGQEFAARHVNTYGEGTADDIIEGTRLFCKEHPFVNDKKLGCLGASYGGFMTQYLMTKTDIFAASMSHAGISNPTSYWGYGYWGYSYSATSAANSYPWNNAALLSGHAPLFNADKVHTPILFLHGGADTNVPINESIQMFTALKILGRECAFVTVEGQDHHILDYDKQVKWVSTYYAWFARWLQDDPTWWNTLYPPKNL